MNDKTGGNRGLRRAGALAVVAAVAVLSTACGGASDQSSASSGPGDPTYAQELALTKCMHSHGEPNFPDPSPSGGFNASVLPVIDSSQGQAAYGACRHLLSGGGPSIAQLRQQTQQANQVQQAKQVQQKELVTLLNFSHCMQGRGVTNWPDPTLSSQGISMNLKKAGINPNSSQVQAAFSACQHLAPGLELGPSAHAATHASAHVS
jgi:hypothetical protein